MVIKLYTLPTCSNCKMVKRFLDNEGIEYQEIDCDKNIEEALSVMKMAGSEELPIIRYDEDNFILGYDPDNLRKFSKLCKA